MGPSILLTEDGEPLAYVEPTGQNPPRILLDMVVAMNFSLGPQATAITEVLKILLEAIFGGIPAETA